MLPAWSQRIAALLAEQGKTAAGLARACDIKPGSVSGWFGGGKPTKMISGDNLVAAASYLGTTPEWIMTGRNPASGSESQPVSVDLEMLKSAIVSVKESLKTLGLELDAFLAAPLIAYAYEERVLLPRVMSKDEYEVFDAMVLSKLQGELGHVGAQEGNAEGSKGRTKAAASARKKTATGKR